MPIAIAEYILDLDRQYQTGTATEHTHRPALQRLLAEMLPQFIVSNEPKQIECGAPDLLLLRKHDNIPAAYVEAKDINDSDLAGKKKNKEQFNRYKLALDNIIFTDYLDFHLYEKGEFIESVRIAELSSFPRKRESRETGGEVSRLDSRLRGNLDERLSGEKITLLKENVAKFESLIAKFGKASPQTIGTSTKLAEMMANKAKLMAEVIEKMLTNGNGNDTGRSNNNGGLAGQMEAVKDILIHDITPKGFSDVYAQTIAYGMFAARLQAVVLGLFNREEAAKLIPKTNPFLRGLFQNIAGFDLDEPVRWIVDDLADIFNATNVFEVMRDFGERTKHEDPMIHFYEDFLAAYDPSLRKNRGVWYTPQPVVNFIVKAVDDILQHDFNLPMGLADTSKTTITIKETTDNQSPKRKQGTTETTEQEVHRVQILDPAAGTGTFLAETVSQIYAKFKGQIGTWQSYVDQHLIPRLNGFEILMAPYTMAHIYLAWIFQQTGYESVGNQRLRIYLTNSLQEYHSGTKTFFHQFLSREANEASSIKRDVPAMVVMGNPPYSGESQNKSMGTWLEEQMNAYKKEPTGENLQERNSKWLNDDYVKFIALGQHFIEKNGSGILAFINNHGFLDNPTFRGMRWSLLNVFDTIYTIDLHGNVKKKETAPDGSRDENVFDIQQGVSINIFVKSGRKAQGELANVYRYDLYGKRKEKFAYLQKKRLQTVKWKKLKLAAPHYCFTATNFSLQREYKKGFSVQELFPTSSVGIVTARDSLTIHYTKEDLIKTIRDFIRLDTEAAREQLNLGKDVRDWSVTGAKKDLTETPDFSKIVEIHYRPFDKRYTYYTGVTKGFHCMPRNSVMRHFLMERPRSNVMQHFLAGKNVGLTVHKREELDIPFAHILVIDAIAEHGLTSSKTTNYVFPLYLYRNGDIVNGGTRILNNRVPNLNENIVNEISQRLGWRFTEEKETVKKTFAPIDILDYIYAVLHSPSYRERYKEFLKVDFPRVPYPDDVKMFWKLVKLGERLRQLHLMENVVPLQGLANYDIRGENVVERFEYAVGKVWINDTQHFDNVSPEVWNFYIGGYQPAQKWLKDRKGRTLNFDEIQHYRKIIRALKETIEIMEKL